VRLIDIVVVVLIAEIIWLLGICDNDRFMLFM